MKVVVMLNGVDAIVVYNGVESVHESAENTLTLCGDIYFGHMKDQRVKAAYVYKDAVAKFEIIV